MEEQNYMPRKLPDFKGYTVDTRLREFRKMEYGKRPEFISFNSKKGQKLLKEMTNQSALEQSLRNSFTAKVERVDLYQKTGMAQVTMKSQGGKLRLTVHESVAKNIKAGAEISIIQNEHGLTIKALKPGIKNSLKR